MKIVVLEVGASGGIAHYTYNLLEALAKHPECEAILLTNTQYELENFKRKFTLIKIPLKGVSYPRMAWVLIKTLRKINPDVLHVQTLSDAPDPQAWVKEKLAACCQEGVTNGFFWLYQAVCPRKLRDVSPEGMAKSVFQRMCLTCDGRWSKFILSVTLHIVRRRKENF